MKFCPECGSKLSEGAKFCESCGTRVAGGNDSAINDEEFEDDEEADEDLANEEAQLEAEFDDDDYDEIGEGDDSDDEGCVICRLSAEKNFFADNLALLCPIPRRTILGLGNG